MGSNQFERRCWAVKSTTSYESPPTPFSSAVKISHMPDIANDKINANLFSYPIKIAIDSEDNVYVADHILKTIQKFSSEGSLLTKWETDGSKDVRFENISGIATDFKNNVYVADLGFKTAEKMMRMEMERHAEKDTLKDGSLYQYTSEKIFERINEMQAENIKMYKFGPKEYE